MSTDLREAIRRKRGLVPSPYQEGSFSDAASTVARHLFEQHLTTLKEDFLPQIEARIKEELVPKIQGMLEQCIRDMLPDALKGDPGIDAEEVDLETLAEEAARRIPPVDTRKIRDQVFSMIPTPTIDHAEVAEHVVKILPKIDETELESRILSKVPTAPELKRETLLEQIHEVPGSIKLTAVEGLKVYLANLDRSIRESARGTSKMIHGGGMTLQAGSGQTLARNSNGTWTLTTSGGSGSGFQAPTGTVDGSNKIFVFATAPNAICVDGGRAMQKVSSDGTVNWTGTTTVTLSVAPDFDVFAVA